MKKDWVALLKQAGFEHIRIQKNTSIDSEYDFHSPDDIDPELYEILEKHLDITFKHRGNLGYRVYSCTKLI